ncbi:MAG: fibronectin type III domain-containing protein, partial [Wenzhouxiangella sp.]|nr:fibronectin type III domain-containing protein [Wenzhouxiangella sp.]
MGATSQPINLSVPECQTSLVLSWDRPVSLNGSTISEYKIEYSTDGGDSWLQASSGTGDTSRSFVDTNASADSSYIYRVASITTDGLVSDWSTPSNAASPLIYAAGCGTEASPYQIETWKHLHNVRQNLDAHFVLKNDLDQTTSGYEDHVKDGATLANGGKGWAPIPTFSGSFDGQGYTISGLEIERGAGKLGLFK